MFCVFFVEYTLDCRDKYKYLKPLWAKWSRYYFTSLGGALTGGHRLFEERDVESRETDRHADMRLQKEERRGGC